MPKSDEDKIRLFHEKLEQYNTELLHRSYGDVDPFLDGGLTQIKFNNSVDHTYFDPKLADKNNSFANDNFSKFYPIHSRFDVLAVPEYADEIFKNEK